jgi:hypothetical protein
MAIPIKVSTRLAEGIRRFNPILEAAKARDVNEPDTVTIVSDVLSEMFGYDKFKELTRELCIKGTYCDLAIRIEDKIRMIIEVKSVSSELKESHIKQAVDYATNKGIEWVALTNGHKWKVFRVLFTQPIGNELALDINFSDLNPKDESDLENLFLLSRESIIKSRPGLEDHYERLRVINKFTIAAVLLSDPILESIRKQLRRLSQEIKTQIDDIREVMVDQVLKRDVMEGEKFEDARRKIQRLQKAVLKKEEDSPPATPIIDPGITGD